jgi:hypothetical protein
MAALLKNINTFKEYLNEGKMQDIADSLVDKFKREVKTNKYDWALDAFMSNRVWTKLDGRKYKEPGKFRAAITYNDDKEAVTMKREVQSSFWPWLIKQSGIKSLGEVSGEFKGDGYSEAVEYKGYVFIKRDITEKHTITEYFSKARFKNSGMWNKK